MTKQSHLIYVAVIVILAATIVWMAAGQKPSILDSRDLGAETASIAILPFSTYGGDDSSDEFAAKTMMMLVDALSRSSHIRVAPESAVIAATDRHLSILEIGRELPVSYVLEGSVVSNAGDLRIAVQLINARNDAHVWARAYEFRTEDLPDIVTSIQSEILGLTT